MTARTRCLQLSVDAARWSDEMLKGYLCRDGKDLSGAEVRDELLNLKKRGYKVFPCNSHKCDDKGVCLGEPL